MAKNHLAILTQMCIEIYLLCYSLAFFPKSVQPAFSSSGILRNYQEIIIFELISPTDASLENISSYAITWALFTCNVYSKMWLFLFFSYEKPETEFWCA